VGIFRRPVVGGDHHKGDDKLIETGNKDIKLSTRGCWRAKDLIGAVVYEISHCEEATKQGNDENVQPKKPPAFVISPESLLKLGSV